MEGEGAKAHWEAEVQQWADACAWLHGHGPWYNRRKNVRERRSDEFALHFRPHEATGSAGSVPCEQRSSCLCASGAAKSSCSTIIWQ